MSDAEDDYLSDKFLSPAPAASSSKPLTYAERRRQAQREAEVKNVQNRKKSRRQLEEETLREGLSKSLFDRAKEEEESGARQANKAMAMMFKMGYKPGQSLGQASEPPPTAQVLAEADAAVSRDSEASTRGKTLGHLVEPLPFDMWTGRQGVGKRKRAVSPAAAERLARVVKQAKQAAEDEARGSFRGRAREEYDERRAEGRLLSATQTCITLDEKAAKAFNVLWLNPQDPESIPSELLGRLVSDQGTAEGVVDLPVASSAPDRLRQQMRADALQPLAPEIDDDSPESRSRDRGRQEATKLFSPALLQDAANFIRQSAQDRLDRVLAYLRAEYFYCFWCGMQYMDLQDLSDGCPGSDEQAHD